MGTDAQARLAFGLALESAMDLPELDRTARAPTDGIIELGKAPRRLENAGVANPWYEAADNRFLLRVPGIARYYVENGNRIVVEQSDSATEEDARVFLMSSVLPVLLLQRGLLALHGAAAVIGGQGTVILGPSHVGKTALALALRDRGCPLLSDECCAVEFQGGTPYILPGIPQLNAWADTLKNSGRNPSQYRPIRSGLEKYAVHEAGMFLGQSVPLSRVVLLSHHNAADTRRVSVTGGQKFSMLLQHVFFAHLFMKDPAFFRTSADIARLAPFVHITYHQRAGQADRLADSIMEDFSK